MGAERVDFDRFAVLLQFAATSGLVLLFGFLGRRVARRRWLESWVWAWNALWLALLAVALHFDVLLPLRALGVLPHIGLELLLDLVYASAKLAFLVALVDGAWTLAADDVPPPLGVRLGAAVAAAITGTVIVVRDHEFTYMVQAQAPLAVLGFLLCAWLVGLRARRGSGWGRPLLGGVFLALGALWLGYGLTQTPNDIVTALPVGGESLLGVLLSNNAVIDAGMSLLLGYGMAIVLAEDVGDERDAERRSQLAALAASQTQLTLLMESAVSAILVVDAEGRVTLANSAIGAMLRRRAAALVGAPLDRVLFAGANWRATLEPPTTAVAEPVRRRVRAQRADGQEFPLEVTMSPLRAGADEGWVLLLRDETEAEAAAAESERLRQRLAQAQRLETVGQLVSGVAHELNNPLAAILAFTEELKHSPMGASEAEALATIEQQALRCRGIVRDLLRVARRRDVRLHPIRPAQLLERVVRGLRPAEGRQAPLLRLVVPPDLPEVIGDDTALEQVVANLVSNALHASPPGGTVAIEAQADDGRLRITVEDDGPGLRPDVQARLFEPFFTTKPVGEGTGLGLAVSRGLMELLGGTITLDNRTDGRPGARATVTLPVAPPTPVAPPPSQRPVTVDGRGRRALVIDDEAPVRAAIRRYLHRMGWRVTEAADGRDALALLSAPDGEPFTVIISDIRMPHLSGIELHDLLAASRPELLRRIVLITGDVASPNVADFLARTWAPIVEKPFDLETLGRALTQLSDPDVSNPQGVPIS